MGGMSIWHWLLVIVVVMLLFGGGKRLRNLGEDLSAGIKSFKKGMAEPDDQAQLKADPPVASEPAKNPADKVDSH
ncbi:MAG: twin-arginine translocase TatA/TatE family subunit [Proteobacteria bacterium]|nr:twin-arginine translocase TatA/TatE family subunit [Pseudomonadota bacterium]